MSAARHYDWIIVGAGFTGATLAERIASVRDQQVLLIDRRDHIGGNAYDELDEYGVLVHRYGPHIFHTNSEVVWRYLSRFTQWRPYFHRVLAHVDGKLIPIPFNFDSIEAVFPRPLADKTMAALLETYTFGEKTAILKLRAHSNPDLRLLGAYVYAKVFDNYTRKQWGLQPEALDPGVTARVPIVMSRDGRYFQDRYQAMPAAGYTKMFERIVNHPNIELQLGRGWKDAEASGGFDRVIYTGPIDEFFSYQHGPLPYRSIRFTSEHRSEEFAQDVGTVNYPNEFDFTRITEFKRLTGQRVSGTTLAYEFPEAYEPGKNEPYYPIPTPETSAALAPYQNDARALDGRVWFAGRLGDYAYYNMDQACARALALFEKQIAKVG